MSDDELVEDENIFKELPKNFSEYLTYYGLDDWPEHMTSEIVLDLRHELRDFKSADELKDILQKDVNIGFDKLDELEYTRRENEVLLMDLADNVLNVDEVLLRSKQTNKIEIKLSDELEKIAEKIRNTSEKVAVYGKTGQSATTNSIKDLNIKSVDFYPYEGYNNSQFTDLPAVVDCKQQVLHVFRKIKIPSIHRKAIKKIISSEASLAIITDLFWWIYLDYFKDVQYSNEKEQYFSRIALDYGILILSITDDNIKEIFLQMYPETLAMVMFTLFYRAFPDSRKQFGPEFKQKIINTCHMWITGLLPLANSFQKWPMEYLQGNNQQIEVQDNFSRTHTTLKPETILLPGFIFTKVLFDPKSCSPLIYRFLQLYDIEPPARTEKSRCLERTEFHEVQPTSTMIEQQLQDEQQTKQRYLQHIEQDKLHQQQISMMEDKRRQLENRFNQLQRDLNSSDSVYEMHLLMKKFRLEDP